ncbi:MAG: hypothetical protein J7L39_03070, partial [Candidatus Aenigmarchaeota archaeon]|nr:hypothetical protein [Candidatus Aenigmarchaeota archaeon]
SIKIVYTIKVGSKKITEEKTIGIKFKNITCAECQRRISEYYGTKIQIRGNFSGDILNKIKDFLSKMKRKDAYISKVEELKEGIDLFVPSKSIGRQIANYIKRRYEVKVLITRKLYGLKDGKKVYKDTILVRFHG